MNNVISLALTILLGLLVTPCGVSAKTNSRIRGVDFNNFTFHEFWGHRPINLTNGKLEFDSPGCHTEYKLKDVIYADLTRDRKEEALIHIEDFTACGSSGISDNYYIYGLQNNRPYLLWRFGTGGFADAGLMNFKLVGRVLLFELFGKYKIVGPKFVSLGRDSISKWDPKHYSRIRVSWDGKRFRQRSLKILPFPYADIHAYWQATGYRR